PKSAKLPKPKDLPERVGMYMVTQLKLDPDWVWSLKGAVRPTADKYIMDLRIFDPKDAGVSDVVIANFDDLDRYPEMILFEGSFNKSTGWLDIRRTTNKAA
ncbi:MAG: hypothetical protein R3274_12155, partial [Desulfobacterales bacterium]|nr:hypothetical protein [Desulfobacterales bacterium]